MEVTETTSAEAGAATGQPITLRVSTWPPTETELSGILRNIGGQTAAPLPHAPAHAHAFPSQVGAGAAAASAQQQLLQQQQQQLLQQQQQQLQAATAATPRVRKRRSGAGSDADDADYVLPVNGAEDSDDEGEDLDDEAEEEEDADEVSSGEDDAMGRAMRGLHKRKEAGTHHVRHYGLSPVLESMVGEANMLYVSGDYEKAKKLLLEIVRQAPNVPDPYQTLGMIYRESGEPKRAMDFFLIAAHIAPSNVTLWKDLTNQALAMKLNPQAIYCLSKALRVEPNDLAMLWQRAMLYLDSGDTQKCIDDLRAILRLQPQRVDVAMELSRVHHEAKQTPEAVQVMVDLLAELEKSGVRPDLNCVNLLAELYMEQGEFEKAIHLIMDTRNRLDVQKFPVQLGTNLGICHLYQGNMQDAAVFLDALQKESVDEYGDLYLSVAETFMVLGEYERALSWYQLVGSCQKYSCAAVWMKQAECYQMLKQRDTAIELFKKVLRDSPLLHKAVISLGDLYAEASKPELAVAAYDEYLSQASSVDKSTRNEEEIMSVKIQKGQTLYKGAKFEDFADVFLPLVVTTIKTKQARSVAKKDKRRPLAPFARGFGRGLKVEKTPHQEQPAALSAESPAEEELVFQLGKHGKKKKKSGAPAAQQSAEGAQQQAASADAAVR
eukprot:TRINITY_DN1632_c0_g2_i8.p1 TRINITY_DN1632_c0_g2~~TRINITY_DN1632_c0_g2_i8.p1  ORF type:complete len:671 (+),score=251.82 TRINITY_DN1632_c0_g2_i8:22-2013(+)